MTVELKILSAVAHARARRSANREEEDSTPPAFVDIREDYVIYLLDVDNVICHQVRASV